MKWRETLVLGGLFAFAGCDLSSDELTERHTHWLENRPASYAYTVQFSGWLEPELLEPKRITVIDNEISSAVYAWASKTHAKGASAPRERVPTIDSVFEDLLRAAEQGSSVRARFDQRWGFVERAFVEGDTRSTQWDVEIREFETPEKAL